MNNQETLQEAMDMVSALSVTAVREEGEHTELFSVDELIPLKNGFHASIVMDGTLTNEWEVSEIDNYEIKVVDEEDNEYRFSAEQEESVSTDITINI